MSQYIGDCGRDTAVGVKVDSLGGAGVGGLVRTCLVEADEGERALNRPGMVQAKGEPRGCNTPV